MPIFKLKEGEQQQRLVNQPETGMGFQIVQGEIEGHDGEIFLVIGSQIILPAKDLDELNSSFLEVSESGTQQLDDYVAAENEFFRGPLVLTSRLDRAVGTRPEISSGIRDNARKLVEPQPLVSEVIQPERQAFFRFSATQKDPRVLPDGSFTAGTYATTFNDVRMVPSGFAAVGRYALPNPFSADHVYVIVTRSDYIVGTTKPDFKQAGGGVEVVFHGGANSLHGESHKIPIS